MKSRAASCALSVERMTAAVSFETPDLLRVRKITVVEKYFA
jgi:hypothetical protein